MWLVRRRRGVDPAAIVARWRTAQPAERLLVLWVLVGFLELIVHDSGNERRYVMFIPAFVALAALLLSQEQPAPVSARDLDPATRVALVPLLLAMSYIVIGALGRLPFLSTSDLACDCPPRSRRLRPRWSSGGGDRQ